MGLVAFCTEDEILVVSTEDEASFVEQTFGSEKRPLAYYRRIEIPSGDAFRASLFQPRLVVGKLIR